MRGVTADPHDGAKAREGEDEIARLLAAPLGDFVEERKRLATQLKSLGRRDEAQAIAKIPKPSSALWAVNQLARHEPEAIRRLAELTVAMQAGPRHAPDDYAQRLAEHRDVLRSLREAAERILVEAKIGVNPALLERIIHTLRAGMADDETRAAIEKARLLREVGELDFTSLLGAGALGGEAATEATGGEGRPPEHRGSGAQAEQPTATPTLTPTLTGGAERRHERARKPPGRARRSASRPACARPPPARRSNCGQGRRRPQAGARRRARGRIGAARARSRRRSAWRSRSANPRSWSAR